jgi:hypothetical protein
MTDRSAWKALTPAFMAALRKYDRASRARLLKRQKQNTVIAPLYHYTSRGGLEGIITSRQIWFTHYQHLNDDTELKFGMSMARAVLAEIGGRVPKLKVFCDWTADLFSAENMSKTLAFYIASFSRNRDDVHQWERYAEGGHGFAIGFGPKLFAVEENLNPPPLENIFVSSVGYGEDTARLQHLPAIKNVTAIILETVQRKAQAMADFNRGIPFFDDMAKRLIAAELIFYSLIVKELKWAPEHEVRLVMYGQISTLAPFVSTRKRDAEIVPYIKKDMPLHEPESITEIIVGYAAPPDAEEFACSLLAPFHSDPRSIVHRSSKKPAA